MKRRIRRMLPALVLAVVIVLAAGMLNTDGWLHASDGQESSQLETGAVTTEDVQGSSATQTLDLTTVPAEETEPSVETTEETTEAPSEETIEPEEITSPTEETAEPTEEEPVEAPSEEETQPEPGIALTAVGYSGVYDGKTHKASCSLLLLFTNRINVFRAIIIGCWGLHGLLTLQNSLISENMMYV